MNSKIPPIGAALCLLIAQGSYASVERIEATYKFIWKGMHVSTAETVTELRPESYSLNIDIRMRGLAKMFMGGEKLAFSVFGDVDENGNITPREFETSGQWKGDPYRQALSYNANGDLTTFVQERSAKWKAKNRRQPVPKTLQRGIDPVSLLVELIRRPANKELALNTSFKVYDGEAAYDWSMQCDEKPVKIKKSKRSDQSGLAHLCILKPKLLAGERVGKSVERISKHRLSKKAGKPTPQQVVKVWMKLVADGSCWMPIRALVPSEKGPVRVYLSSIVTKTATLEPMHFGQASSK